MKYKIWLTSLSLDNSIKLKLLLRYKKEQEIYNNFEDIIRKEISLYLKFKDINNGNLLNQAEKVCEWMKKNNIGFICISDNNYPLELRFIDNAPYGLFYKGDLNVLNNRKVAIVGSRKCTNYGIQVTKMLTNELNSFNITIISGGAKGIDTAAHAQSLESSGATVVVLGCGIDIVYPAQNKRLFENVANHGLVLSEFMPGVKPYSYNFPTRNRIISGLSELILLTEATVKSGSLITANFALAQGKDVMAVPGSIFSKESEGCNNLIYDGAHVLTSLEDLRLILKLDLNKKYKTGNTINQKKILEFISNEPKHIDEIFKNTLIERESLFNTLFEMQKANQIISLPGSYYAKII